MNAMFRLCIALIALLLPLGAQNGIELSLTPARTYGHVRSTMSTFEANLVEGRELNGPLGVVVDTNTSPPTVYVADSGNNRVLYWQNAKGGNGQFANGVVGQRDLLTTFAGGPGTTYSVGFRSPSGLALDSRGNLYVADNGNNRILRFPRPSQQNGDSAQPDMVIGQTNFTSNQSNLGAADASARSLSFSRDGVLYSSSLRFDAQGNLWASDPGNHRVVRYPAAVLNGSPANGPEADLVLGQPNFATRAPFDTSKQGALYKGGALFPSALAIDSGGRLFVSDSLGRVLVYAPPFASGMPAVRLLGISVNVQGQTPRPPVNEYTVGAVDGMFMVGDNLFVSSLQFHRIMRFDPYPSWEAESAAIPSPAAKAVYGQADMYSFKANRGGRSANETSLSRPTSGAVAGSDVYLADTGNNRLLVLPLSGVNLGGAAAVQGQATFFHTSRNLIEGREMYTVTGLASIPYVPDAGGGRATLSGDVVVDRRSSPPRLYIADTGNNRILAYADARGVKPGDVADLIIGQTDRFSSVINSPTNDEDAINDTGLRGPTGVAVDSDGNLWVADTGNSRVLRFPTPFAQPHGQQPRANLVLGQSGFSIKLTDASSRNMSAPFGLAFTVEGHLLVSDYAHNRILLFLRPAGGGFTTGQAAATVIGQKDFSATELVTGDKRFNTPHHIATDTDDRLYVADTGKSRIVIFDRVVTAANDPSPALILTQVSQYDVLGNPQAVAVSARTGEIWVADTGRNRVLRYPRFDSLILSPLPDYKIDVTLPVGVALDPLDNLVIADGSNRLAFHYPRLVALSAAHYLNRPLSPGMVATMGPVGIRFGEETAVFSTLPLPKRLADTEVLINEKAVPLYFVSPAQINFYVPMDIPTAGTIDVIVQRKSTSQILASSTLPVAPATPSFFTTTQNGRGQIAALNQDNSINSAGNPAARGQVIQLYATGQGFIANAPPDGEAPTGALSTSSRPRVVLNTGFLEEKDILYSGLAPTLVGVWQINVRIPMTVPPSSAVPVVVLHEGIPSNQASSGGGTISTTIAVK